ncbi:hypothetical protein ACFL43_03005 [Thermodesulfobacteriota bacterium]
MESLGYGPCIGYALVIVMLVYLWRGSGFAKFILVLCALIDFIIMLMVVFVPAAQQEFMKEPGLASRSGLLVGTSASAVMDIVVIWFLLFSKAVRLFLAGQKAVVQKKKALREINKKNIVAREKPGVAT